MLHMAMERLNKYARGNQASHVFRDGYNHVKLNVVEQKFITEGAT